MIDTIFQTIQQEIAEEIAAKNTLNDLEQEFITTIAPIKNEYAKAGLILPSELQDAFFATTQTPSWAAIHADYTARLEQLECKKIQKDRVSRKINEEIILLLLTHRYFHAIAVSFKSQEDPIMISSGDQEGVVMTPSEVGGVLGVQVEYTDYLLSLLKLTDIMVGFTTNTVINASMKNVQNDYAVGYVNSSLISNLENGFKQLDLKNDNVRRRYDGLKYNLKRINEVVYDLSLRRLLPEEHISLR